MKVLRADQSDALQALRQAVGDGKKRICMQAPTGWGKTVFASKLVENARERKKRLLYTVPTIALVDQTVDMFYQQKIYDVGVIQATHHMTDWNQPVQIASVQSLMKRTIPDADVVLIDECHRWFEFYGKWLLDPKWSHVPFIGMSATPWTKGLGSWYDHFHRASTTLELIDAGLLSPFKVYAPTHPDLSDVRTVAGDYHEGELSAKMSEQTLVADAVDTWVRLGEDRPTLCYAVDRVHAKHLQTKFSQAGISCGYIDAYTKDAERAAVKRGFHNGTFKVVCNVGCLTTGIDWDVRCISLCRPTKSDMLFVQIVGRGLRTANGKNHCLILDHSDNHLRLGFVTDVDASYTGLHIGKTPAHDNRTAGIRLPKECPKCAFLKPPRMAKCPACGFEAQAHCKIVADAGELRELKVIKRRRNDDEPAPTTQAEKAAFYAELKGYAQRHNYKPGWAANKYRERIGTWPAHDMKHVAPTYPRFATLNWIKHCNIAWAKSKARESMPQGTLSRGTIGWEA